MKPFIPQALPITEIDWETLIPLIGQSRHSLGRYDGLLKGIANPQIFLSPMTAREATLSSKIEGTQATLGEVFKYEAGEKPDEQVKQLDILEIINYRNALALAESQLKDRPFNLNLLLMLHDMLLSGVRGQGKSRGNFRKIQNWIGKPGSGIEEADFVPPAPLELNRHLDNWEKYYHMERPDPLAQLAVVHAQFEIIHPFLDGNGRLGRMLIPMFLYEKGLLPQPVFYMSEYLEENREEYILRLREIGRKDGAWNKWIIFFLKGIDEQARSNAAKATAILVLYDKLKVRVTELTRSKFAIHLLDLMFKRPVFHAAHLKFPGNKPSKVSVSHWMKTLINAEILKVLREASGSRPQLLALAELINLCEGKKAF